ncbi:hypothetical protein HDV05_005371 [Chytridiales sp. JEL 0842]|nr:hypothetical protein HDV05_005371 [Chytridiales sp. JEL 0842]
MLVKEISPSTKNDHADWKNLAMVYNMRKQAGTTSRTWCALLQKWKAYSRLPNGQATKSTSTRTTSLKLTKKHERQTTRPKATKVASSVPAQRRNSLSLQTSTPSKESLESHVLQTPPPVSLSRKSLNPFASQTDLTFSRNALLQTPPSMNNQGLFSPATTISNSSQVEPGPSNPPNSSNLLQQLSAFMDEKLSASHKTILNTLNNLQSNISNLETNVKLSRAELAYLNQKVESVSELGERNSQVMKDMKRNVLLQQRNHLDTLRAVIDLRKDFVMAQGALERSVIGNEERDEETMKQGTVEQREG